MTGAFYLCLRSGRCTLRDGSLPSAENVHGALEILGTRCLAVSAQIHTAAGCGLV